MSKLNEGTASTTECESMIALQEADEKVSRSTERRYSEVVQEYMKSKLGKVPMEIHPSQVLTSHADNAGPDEGSYVSWECPDTPGSQSPRVSFSEKNPEFYVEDEELNSPEFKVVSLTRMKYNSEDSPLLGSNDSKSTESPFRNFDPFSPQTSTGDKLSFYSAVSNESRNVNLPPGLNSSRERNGSYIPTPDSLHGYPLSTFSPNDGNPKHSASSLVQSPINGHDNAVSRQGPVTSASPRIPAIRITSVEGSSHKVNNGTAEISSNAEKYSPDLVDSPSAAKSPSSVAKSPSAKIPFSTSRSPPCDAQKSPSISKYQTPQTKDKIVMQDLKVGTQSYYPPGETDANSYRFRTPVSAKTFIVAERSARGSYTSVTSEDWDMVDFDEDSASMKKLQCQKYCGLILIIMGFIFVIAGVTGILAIEIPNYREEILDTFPESLEFINSVEKFRDFVFTSSEER